MSWKDKYILKQPGKLMGELMGKKESNVRPPNATKPVYGVGQMEGREGTALKDLQPPGKRDDGGKLSWHLIPIPAMLGFVKVWHGGAIKYAEEQWRGGMKYSRIYRPMISHFNKWMCSKSSYDKELKTHHLMMVAWGCFVLFMYEIIFKRTDLDDRPDKGVMDDEDFEIEGELIAPEAGDHSGGLWEEGLKQKKEVDRLREEERSRHKENDRRDHEWRDFREEDWKKLKSFDVKGVKVEDADEADW
jgi:hypothetical protein